jgi:hypothetical protein
MMAILPFVKHRLLSIVPCVFALILAGCLTTPVSESGGPGSVTVVNTNPNALINAAQRVFANYGYATGLVNFPTSISFDKPANRFGRVMWGSFNQTTTIRVRLAMTPIPGSNDFRLSTRVYTVSSAGVAGFENKRALRGMWSSEFGPLLRQINAQAAGAGSRM